MQTLGDTIAYVEAKALVDTLGDRIEEEVDSLYDIAVKVEAKVLIHKVAASIARWTPRR